MDHLVDLLLQVQRVLDGSQRRVPLVAGRGIDGLEQDASSAQILVFDQLPGVFVLLLGRVHEKLGQTFERHVVTAEMRRLNIQKTNSDDQHPADFIEF